MCEATTLLGQTSLGTDYKFSRPRISHSHVHTHTYTRTSARRNILTHYLARTFTYYISYTLCTRTGWTVASLLRFLSLPFCLEYTNSSVLNKLQQRGSRLLRSLKKRQLLEKRERKLRKLRRKREISTNTHVEVQRENTGKGGKGRGKISHADFPRFLCITRLMVTLY